MTTEMVESGFYTNFGPLERRLTARLQERYGTDKLLLFNNGTIALLTALLALPKRGGTIITTPFTFPATVHCIKLAGFDVRFCDVETDSFNLDASQLTSASDEATKAVLAVHVYGNPCDVQTIGNFCKSRGLLEVYDAAHCFDAYYAGKPIFAYGTASMASLHATKLMQTGEGGVLFINDVELFRNARSAMNFGIQGEDIVDGLGLNGKLSEINAALGLSVLPNVAAEIARRRLVSERYDLALAEGGGVRPIAFRHNTVRNYLYYPVAIDGTGGFSRDELWAALRARNIYARKYFFPLLSRCRPYSDDPKVGTYPNAEKAAQEVLCLPIHSGVTDEDIAEIVGIIDQLRGLA